MIEAEVQPNFSLKRLVDMIFVTVVMAAVVFSIGAHRVIHHPGFFGCPFHRGSMMMTDSLSGWNRFWMFGHEAYNDPEWWDGLGYTMAYLLRWPLAAYVALKILPVVVKAAKGRPQNKTIEG